MFPVGHSLRCLADGGFSAAKATVCKFGCNPPERSSPKLAFITLRLSSLMMPPPPPHRTADDDTTTAATATAAAADCPTYWLID